MDPVISESCYKGKILQKNYMVISHNSSVQFYAKTIWDPQLDRVISKSKL